MHDHHGHLNDNEPGQKILPVCPDPKQVAVSPLGLSIKGRLLWAGFASALLWLSVAWAIGRLP